jgi:putative toxin-antitoxin system antitoxin component (TIGR02293 family)
MAAIKHDELKRGELINRVIYSKKAEYNEFLKETATYSKSNSNTIATLKYPKILNDDRNVFHLIGATRNGLPYQSLRFAQENMPFSSQEWAKMLHISKRTIDRLKEQRKKLSSIQSEKLIEVTLLYEYGVSVFGSSDKFSKWLTRPNIGLGGIIPKSLFDTNQGIKVVESELSRIEHGVLA